MVGNDVNSTPIMALILRLGFFRLSIQEKTMAIATITGKGSMASLNLSARAANLIVRAKESLSNVTNVQTPFTHNTSSPVLASFKESHPVQTSPPQSGGCLQDSQSVQTPTTQLIVRAQHGLSNVTMGKTPTSILPARLYQFMKLDLPRQQFQW
ncbi:hypothetical protein ACH5RR_036968 [Cinchona calisaya]|uniref:Uncharacterized protein n=1 Tax=Cinchona calisaya TaxID=153742 RepID=A0ABD2Y973_9GENT